MNAEIGGRWSGAYGRMSFARRAMQLGRHGRGTSTSTSDLSHQADLRPYAQHMNKEVPTDAEAQRLELQEAIATARQSATLSVQIAGFLATADSLLLAYGFAQRQGGIFLVASLLPILFLAIGVVMLRAVIPVGYVAMVLERELGLRAAPFATIFALRLILGTQPADLTSDILNKDLQALLFSTSSARVVLASKPAYVLYLLSALQFVLFLTATFVGHFRFM
jgi:hypothetical protein